ncbi:MAG: type III secretion system cytoplasmic ring protein SctQ [Myxococcota bacterium]
MADASAYTRKSRTYEPDDPDLRHMGVRPFRLDELRRIPREHRDVHRALHRVLPEAVFESGFIAKVRQELQRYTEMDIDLWQHAISIERRTQLRAMIPGISCLVVVGLPPLQEKVIFEIDLRFVYRSVDRLLGSHGVAVDTHRPLSDIEQGVFSFLLLKVLHLFQQNLQFPEQVAVRLEDIRSDLKSVADIVRNDDYWLVASWKMNFDLDVSYVRALVPTSMVRRLVPDKVPPDSALAQRMRDHIEQRMWRLDGLNVDCPIEIGHMELAPSDIAALDPGDIVLFDQCNIQLQEGEPVGPATMKIGLGQNVIIHGLVGPQDGHDGRKMTFQVQQLLRQKIPGTHDPHIVHGTHGNPEEVMAEYEEPHYGENDDGDVTADDIIDEEYGLDDENEGDDEQYYDEYSEQQYADPPYSGQHSGQHSDQKHPPQEQQYADQEYGAEPDAVGPSEEVNFDDANGIVESEALLGDVPVNAVVELGRVQLTADEVIRLSTGHIMELGRSPAEPVDLVVNGRLLAKGELVEIEGSLGVKILSLVKGPGE